MITKILLTALIVIAVAMYFRRRTAMRVRADEAHRGAVMSWPWRILPGALLLTALLVGAGMFWLEWREAHQLYLARVIDTRTGQVTTYEIYRDQVQGRSFQTVDGRTVTLADVERLEIVQK